MCQVNFYSVELFLLLPYNIIIDRRETNMTDSDFFRLDQDQWFSEFVESQLPENFSDINTHREKFEFDDIPF
jgi:hypothetical protein